MEVLLVGLNSHLESGNTLMLDKAALWKIMFTDGGYPNPALLLDKQVLAVDRSDFYQLWLVC